jgi:UDP:flavonoid glycosyltransferase YjiC (YdhE family)
MLGRRAARRSGRSALSAARVWGRPRSQLSGDGLVQGLEPHTPFGVFARLRDLLLCGPALELARDTLDEVERETADAMAVDLFLFGAMAAAERAGVPWAALTHTVYPLPPGRPPFGMGLRRASGPAARVRDAVLTAAAVRTFATGRCSLNEARIALGLPALAHTLDQVRRAARPLVLSSAAFDFPFRELPPGVRYVGPALDRPRAGSDWESPWPPDHADPLVLVSFSTTFQDHQPMLERVVGALDGLPARGLVTLGPVFDPASIHAPTNVPSVDGCLTGPCSRRHAPSSPMPDTGP